MDGNPLYESVSVGGRVADWIEDDGWYRPNSLNFFPITRRRENELLIDEIRKHVLHGWLPPLPFISRRHLVTAFGSCFAYYVERYLREKCFNTSIAQYGGEHSNYWSKSLIIKNADGFVNTFSLRYQLEWIFEQAEPDITVWHKWDGRVRRYLDDNKAAAQDIVRSTNVFIFTLGIAEVWHSKPDGKVLWAAVPRSEYQPDRFGFRVTTVEENRANLARCVELIRRHIGPVPIVLTLSPHAMNATFRPISCISANSASKAILRVAIDEFMRSNIADENIHYFPSYEIVTGYLHDPFGMDKIHLKPEAIDAVMASFIDAYCISEEAELHFVP